MRVFTRHLGAVALVLALSACSTTTRLSSMHPGTIVVVKGEDMDNQVIRYKRKPPDSWREYRPTPEEAKRAQRFYEEDTDAGTGAAGAANK